MPPPPGCRPAGWPGPPQAGRGHRSAVRPGAPSRGGRGPARGPTVRSPRPGGSSRHEPDPRAGCEQGRLHPPRVPERGVGGADDLPAAGRRHGVDTAPGAGQGDRPRRDPGPRRRQPRHRARQPRQVGEPGAKPQKADTKLGGRVPGGHLVDVAAPSGPRRSRGRGRRRPPGARPRDPAAWPRGSRCPARGPGPGRRPPRRTAPSPRRVRRRRPARGRAPRRRGRRRPAVRRPRRGRRRGRRVASASLRIPTQVSRRAARSADASVETGGSVRDAGSRRAARSLASLGSEPTLLNLPPLSLPSQARSTAA